MSVSVHPSPHPYRSPAPPCPAPVDAADGFRVGQQLAHQVLVVWALVRVGVCAVTGLDFEGFVALVIAVTAIKSLLRSFA
jgi:hypothetical protein